MKKPFKASRRLLRLSSRRGTGLFVALIMATLMSMMVISVMRVSNTEVRTSSSHYLNQQARLAALTVADLMFSEMERRFEQFTNLAENNMKVNPPDVESRMKAIFPDDDSDLLFTVTWDIKEAAIPTKSDLYYVTKTPENMQDPHRGKMVSKREVPLYAKATVKHKNLGLTATCYVAQQLQVRDSPLLSNAVFYNMDLELHPGPSMDIKGPVHTNGNAYIQSQGGLKFYSSFTASGHFYHGYKKNVEEWGGDGAATQSNYVRFLVDGSWKDLKDSDGNWLDASHDEWHDLSEEIFRGGLQDAAHGTPTLNPVAIKDYVPDNPFTTANEFRNYGYALIEPILATSHQDYKGEAITELKFAYLAGLILRYADTYPDGSTIPVKDRRFRAYRYERTNPYNALSKPVMDSTTGRPKEVEVFLPPGLIGDAALNMLRISPPAWTPLGTPGYFADAWEYFLNWNRPEPYAQVKWDGNGSWKVSHGMYEDREGIALDVASVDLEYLRWLVDDTYEPANLTKFYDSDVGGSDGEAETSMSRWDKYEGHATNQPMINAALAAGWKEDVAGTGGAGNDIVDPSLSVWEAAAEGDIWPLTSNVEDDADPSSHSGHWWAIYHLENGKDDLGLKRWSIPVMEDRDGDGVCEVFTGGFYSTVSDAKDAHDPTAGKPLHPMWNYFKDCDAFYNPVTDWNGVVYVEMPTWEDSGDDPSVFAPIESGARADQIVSAKAYRSNGRNSGTPYLTYSGYLSDDLDGDFFWISNIEEKLEEDVFYEEIVEAEKFANPYNTPPEYESGDSADSDETALQFAYTDGIVVQLINGSTVPYPTYAGTEFPGLNMATNAPLYLVGNMNADGKSSTGTSTKLDSDTTAGGSFRDAYYNERDSADRHEPPFGVACDTFTVLSVNWNARGALRYWRDYSSNNDAGRYFSIESNKNNREGAYTEIAVAAVTGLKPTTPDDADHHPDSSYKGISGGVHNFPRFLEEWGTALRIRGSLVALFESEVHEDAMQNTNHYSPPTRDWGFSDNFAGGIYPPGMPNTRSYPRSAFRELTVAEWNAIE